MTTYLYDSTIRSQLISKLVEAAQLLESNCPKAVINYTKTNLAVNFDSTDPQNPTVAGLTYSWNFGDGQTGNTTSKTLSHNYSVAGTYNVSLAVTDSFGASDTASVIVDLHDSSIFGYKYIGGILKYKTIIDDSSNGRFAGIYWSQSVTISVNGPIGEIVSLVQRYGIGDIDCGSWTRSNPSSFFHDKNIYSCQREAEQPAQTTITMKEISQCGGQGCPGILTGLEVNINYYNGSFPSIFYLSPGVDPVNAGDFHYNGGNLPSPPNF